MADHYAGVGDQFFDFFGGLPDASYPVVQVENLPVTLQFAEDGFFDDIIGILGDEGFYGETLLGGGGH